MCAHLTAATTTAISPFLSSRDGGGSGGGVFSAEMSLDVPLELRVTPESLDFEANRALVVNVGLLLRQCSGVAIGVGSRAADAANAADAAAT